jgi:hypothetical protein
LVYFLGFLFAVGQRKEKPMKIKDANGSTKILPAATVYVLGARPATLTPCFNYSEAALVEWFLKEKGIASVVVNADGLMNRRLSAVLSPDLIREAAVHAQATKTRYTRSTANGRAKQYLISSTARRILIPFDQKRRVEVLRERARKGE